MPPLTTEVLTAVYKDAAWKSETSLNGLAYLSRTASVRVTPMPSAMPSARATPMPSARVTPMPAG